MELNNTKNGETLGLSIGLPQVTKRSKVVRLDYKKRLIEVQLQDGTILYMTRKQFERIGGSPVKPNQSILTIVFQRVPWDHRKMPSQILKAFSEDIPTVK